MKAFLDAELWTPMERGWRITEYAVTQTSRDQLAALENLRVREREKKARQRAKKAAATGADADVPGTVPGDVPPDNTGQDRPGKDRPGEEGDHLRLAAGAENVKWLGAGPSPYDEYN